MGRPKKQVREPFWFADRGAWYVTAGTTKVRLSPDKTEAWRLWHELMARGPATPGEPARKPGESRFVAELLDAFLGWCERNRSPRTFDVYRMHLETFAASAPPRLAVDDLRPHHVTAAADAREWSNNTKHQFIVTVKRALNWCVDQGLIDRSPIARMQAPAIEAREAAATPADMQLMLAAADNPEIRNLIEMGWETGARLQELRVVEARFVDLGARRIVFPPSKAKGKRHHRVIYLGTDRAVELATELCRLRPSGPILLNTRGGPWNKDSVNCAFQRLRVRMAEIILERSGRPRPTLPEKVPRKELARARAERRAAVAEWKAERGRLAKEGVPALHFGAIRKGYATEALKAGVDVIGLAHLMGHRDAAMLSRVYARPQQDPEYMASMARKARGPRSGPGGASA